ncbi:MAG: fibrillarin-like rRNA/tRNA 2'-O-methyltransferase [Thaumarchaeota archaeon]|nr:MAG: fibrillarin-like rRNA/tRNA 2'-O-methyltransferase [Nitrososphaerota archaeon]
MRNLWRGEEAGRVRLATRSLAPGTRAYNEELLKIGGEEYRTWDPYRSKLAAALVKGFPDGVIQEGERVLYLGTSTGTTPSHVSDLIGERGLLIGVEFAPRVAREFVENVARVRGNVIPYVADAREPDAYSTIGRVDLVYCDIAQQDQTEIAIQNCRVHLRTGGRLMLVVKSRSIDVVREPEEIFREERKKLEEAGFEVIQVVGLEPFEKDHAMILARFRG